MRALIIILLLSLASSVLSAPPPQPPVPYGYPFENPDPHRTLYLFFNSSIEDNADSPSHQALELWRASFTYVHDRLMYPRDTTLIQTWVKMMPEYLDSVEKDKSFVIASYQGTSASAFELGVTNDRHKLYWESYVHHRTYSDSLPDLLDGLYHYIAVAVVGSTWYDLEGIPIGKIHRIKFYLDGSCVTNTVASFRFIDPGYVRGVVMGGVHDTIRYNIAYQDSSEHRWPGKMCVFFVSTDNLYPDSYFQENWDRFEPIVRFNTPVIRTGPVASPTFSVFPNPTHSLSALRFGGFDGVVGVVNIQGQTIFTGTPADLRTANVPSAPGLYFITTQSAALRTVRPLFVVR